MSRFLPWLVLAACLFGTGERASATPQPSISPADFTSFEFKQHPGAALPLDATFHGTDGRPVVLGSLFGQTPVVLDFEYGRCQTLCGIMLDELTAALHELPFVAGRDYSIIAVDIDASETPGNASDFAEHHGAAGPGIHVLTGDAATIGRLADAAGFPYRWDASIAQFAHPAGFVVATPQGRISRYLFGLSWRPFDLRLALTEAAGEGIGTTASQLLLFCYCYDPQTGQYDLAIANLLKALGTFTILSIGGLMWAAVRRTA